MLRTLNRLRQEDANSFAGILVRPDGSIELHLTEATPASVRAVDDARAIGRDAVSVRVVEGLRNSLAVLERAHDVKGLTPESAELLAREFGADRVDVVEGGEWGPTHSP
jgi:hypothetical protein